MVIAVPQLIVISGPDARRVFPLTADAVLGRLSTNHLARTVRSSHDGMVSDADVAAESADAITAVVASARTGRPVR